MSNSNRHDKLPKEKSLTERRRFDRPTFAIGILGGALIALAFPPVGWSILAWVGAAVLVSICMSPRQFDRSHYLALYMAGFFHWMLVTHWIRLPHPAAYLGWFVLSAYLAIYLPIFVGLTRQAISLRLPVVIAAPIVWCGLEAVRARAFTGFAVALLGHTQVDHPALIQIADLCGAYTVSFVVMLVAAGLAQLLPPNGSSNHHPPAPRHPAARWAWLAVAMATLAATIAYGKSHLQTSKPTTKQTNANGRPSIRVALIQGAIDTKFDGVDHTNETLSEYVAVTREALAKDEPVDLIVWPESMYAFPWVSIDTTGPLFLPPGTEATADQYRKHIQDWEVATFRQAEMIARSVSTPMLAGAAQYAHGPEPMKRFNSALYLDAQGGLLDSYSKMHPVLFGEYVPLGDVFPWLYRLTPMGSGLQAGSSPKCFVVDGIKISPSICFENMVPHLMRRQYRALREDGNEPDAMVTITNDGWFWGSSLLDLHLTCGVFRAIELRTPLLISANTGFSAWIDEQGRVLKKGPRRAAGFILAKLSSGSPSKSVYLACGDVPAGLCSAICGVLGLIGWRQRRPAKLQ